MRLALVAALLITCFCGQGCASFFLLGNSPDAGASAYKQRSINTGVISGALYVLGSACLAAGIANNHDGGEQVFFSLEAGTALNMLGGVLVTGGSATGILSLVWALAHRRRRMLYGGGERDGWDDLRRRYGGVSLPRAGPTIEPESVDDACLVELKELEAHRYLDMGGFRILRQ